MLNDDNLNALNVPAKKPLQSNVLDMVDALCSNPCSLDTNIQQQASSFLYYIVVSSSFYDLCSQTGLMFKSSKIRLNFDLFLRGAYL